MADPNAPTLQTPVNNIDVIGNVIEAVFTVPSDSDNDKLVFSIEFDTNNPINSGSANYKQNESRLGEFASNGVWEVDNGSGTFIPLPTGGIGSTYYGRDAKVILRKQDVTDYPDIDGTWYWRISAGDAFSGSTPVYNQVVFGTVRFNS